MKFFTLTLILSTILFWGLWGFFGKLAVQKIGIQSSFWNALSFVLIILSFLLVSGQLLPLKNNPSGIFLALLAGVCSGLASVLFYILLGKNPVGFLVTITALYPLVTIILSAIFLKEPLTLTKSLGFFFALVALIFLNL